MRPKRRLTGKFWPAVRARIWEKAEELHAKDFYDGHEENITRPTRRELREGGYFHTAKCIILREINKTGGDARIRRRQDEEAFQTYLRTRGPGGQK